MATIVFYSDRIGDTLSLRLSSDNGSVVSTVPFSEVDAENKPLRYEATVDVAVGWYTAQVSDADGVIYSGRVNVAGTGSYLIDDPYGALNAIEDSLDRIEETQEEQGLQLDGQDTALSDITDDIAAVSEQIDNITVDVDPEVIEEAIRDAIGDGVMISDAAVAKLVGTISRFVFPAWNGTGFDKSFTCGSSYSGSLRPYIPVTNWQGSQTIGSSTSVTFTGVRAENCEEDGFSFVIDPESLVTEGDITTIYVALTDAQTLSVSPGLYRCDINLEWSNGEKFSLFPDGFACRFRAINKAS